MLNIVVLSEPPILVAATKEDVTLVALGVVSCVGIVNEASGIVTVLFADGSVIRSVVV